MNTPIIDAAALLFYDAYAMADTARRLDLDRAALMEALEKFEGCFDCHECTETAESALAAARANFPTP